jgi:hypothetical protein
VEAQATILGQERSVCQFATSKSNVSLFHQLFSNRLLTVAEPSATTPDLSNLDICESPIDSGDCKGSFTRYGFDVETNACKLFKYGGFVFFT